MVQVVAIRNGKECKATDSDHSIFYCSTLMFMTRIRTKSRNTTLTKRESTFWYVIAPLFSGGRNKDKKIMQQLLSLLEH